MQGNYHWTRGYVLLDHGLLALTMGISWQQLMMGMLQNMTNLFAKITARGDAMDEPYYRIAENNLVYAVGKQLQVSSSGDGGGRDSDHVNIAVSWGQGLLHRHECFTEKYTASQHSHKTASRNRVEYLSSPQWWGC